MISGIYIHIPFCHQDCNYCHFVTAPYDDALMDIYTASVIKEMTLFSQSCENRMEVDTIYFGGGTPSLLPEEHIENLLDACSQLFVIQNRCEISMEANPDTLGGNKAALLRQAGINRLSIGAQSFQDPELRALGRRHDAEAIIKSVRLSKSSGIANINLDLLLGVPYQTPKSWRDTLTCVSKLDMEHVSVYMLDLDEPCNLSEAVSSGKLSVPVEDTIAEMYLEAIDLLNSFGYAQYEISNFARNNKACLHNQKYWKQQPVIGFGLSSHSFDGAVRYANFQSMESYVQSLQSTVRPVEWHKTLDKREKLQERLFLGLRMNEGVDWAQLQKDYPLDCLQEYENAMQRFIQEGMVQRKGSMICLTPRGMLLSNEIFQNFV